MVAPRSIARCATCARPVARGASANRRFPFTRSRTSPCPIVTTLTVQSVSVTGGSVTVSLRHDLGFPLLKRGEVDIQVWSSGGRNTEPKKLREFSLDRDFVGGTPVVLYP